MKIALMNLRTIFKYNHHLNVFFFVSFIGCVTTAVIQNQKGSFWFLSFLSYILFFFFGVAMTLHRVVAHDVQNFPKFLLYPFSLLGSLVHIGTPLEWYLGHNLHHQLADEPNDPILPNLKGFNYILGVYQPMATKDITTLLLKSGSSVVMKSSFLQSLSKYFYLYVAFIYGLVFAIFGLSGVLILNLGSVGTMIAVSFMSHWTHCESLGYVNFQLPNRSRNLVLTFPLFFGEQLHNNHHASPKKTSNRVGGWEVDLIGLCLDFFLRVFSKERKV